MKNESWTSLIVSKVRQITKSADSATLRRSKQEVFSSGTPQLRSERPEINQRIWFLLAASGINNQPYHLQSREREMAASVSMCTLLPTRLSGRPSRQSFFHSAIHQRPHNPNFRLRVQAAKLPAGVELPKVQPKLTSPMFGFTRTAEIWNSRACMIGLIGTFIVELILNKGILEVIGVDVGKGLDIPL